jgi:hypothetical protein
MAGSSVTITRKKLGDVIKIKMTWVSDDSTGAVTSASAGNVTTFPVVGYLMRATTVPSGTAPTALYDITIVTEDGIDVLNGLGADRSATVTESKTNLDGLPLIAATSLTLTVANAGNSKGGDVYLLVMDLSGMPL